MIERKVVDRYAHQSGVKDQLVAEREVVLTYALHALGEAKTLDLLAFKGGTCLRKIVFGSTGRFSEDLDFTLRGDDAQEALTALYEVFNREHHGVAFSLEDEGGTRPTTASGWRVQYRHGWNASGKFRLQVSTREKPTLRVSSHAMTEQLYFKDMEFEPFDVPCLEPIEMAAEKVRAAFQRAKVRDLYDLHLLARRRLDGDLLRGLVVLKLWQVRDAFDAAGFFGKLRGAAYDWEDLRRLLRPSERLEQETIIAGIERDLRTLRELTELEVHVCIADAKKGARNEPLGGRLRAEIRERYAHL